jgi:hypothetical protein
MHVVVELPGFVAAVRAAGRSRRPCPDHRSHRDTTRCRRCEGGARKVRIAGRGKGKSGGYRVITFYAGVRFPVFLLALYAKGERANLTKAERNELRSILGSIVETYRKGALRRA